MNFVTIRIPRQSMIEYLTGSRDLELPEGTRIESMWIDDRERLVLKIQHHSFPENVPGMRIPRVQTLYKIRRRKG